ncbi:hypothetical protein STAFG_5937 [Streptomyces afghaniensis 772]|uniref:ABC transporter domain-containing protein n=1 Tax=Streptomyces afghaniensis 772 TaxID=1283301 RepID=S4NF40_9ACTN|nr:hypothetical protein STAFG_5937 [Streptomyces afghaniensis 772]
MTVAENIALTTGYARRTGLISWQRTRERCVDALRTVAGHLDPDAPVSGLAPAERSLVAIARALAARAKLIVLDEPTARLPAADSARLFGVLHDLRDRGHAILYVSHRLDEVYQVADTYAVLRDGRLVSHGRLADHDPTHLVHDIVGENPEPPATGPSPTLHPTETPAADGRAGTPAADSRAGTRAADGRAGTRAADGRAGTRAADGPADTPAADHPAGTPAADRPVGMQPVDRSDVSPGVDRPAGAPPADGPVGTPAADRPAGAAAGDHPVGMPAADRSDVSPGADRPAGRPPTDGPAEVPATDHRPELRLLTVRRSLRPADHPAKPPAADRPTAASPADHPARPRAAAHPAGATPPTARPAKPPARTPPVLTLDGVRTARAGPVSLELGAGEVLGLVGLSDAGHTELGRALAGDRPLLGGRALLLGRPYQPRTVAEAVARGVGFVPGDRLREGCLAELTVRENLLANPRAGGRPAPRWIGPRRERVQAAALIDRFSVRPRDSEAPIATLSGGNQQKVMIGRWLRTELRLLILEEPTASVDIGAKAAIHRLLDDTLSAGLAVLLLSTDFEEVASVCGRTLVFVRGVVTAELSGSSLTVTGLTGAPRPSPPPPPRRPRRGHDRIARPLPAPLQAPARPRRAPHRRLRPARPHRPALPRLLPRPAGHLPHPGHRRLDPVQPVDPGRPRAGRHGAHRDRRVRPLHRLRPRTGPRHGDATRRQRELALAARLPHRARRRAGRRRPQRRHRRVRPDRLLHRHPRYRQHDVRRDRLDHRRQPDRPGPAGPPARVHRPLRLHVPRPPGPRLLRARPRGSPLAGAGAAAARPVSVRRRIEPARGRPRRHPDPHLHRLRVRRLGADRRFRRCAARVPAADRQPERRPRLPAARLRRRPARLHGDQTRPAQRPRHRRRRRRPGRRPHRHRPAGRRLLDGAAVPRRHPAHRRGPGRIRRPPPVARRRRRPRHTRRAVPTAVVPITVVPITAAPATVLPDPGGRCRGPTP